MYNQSEESIFVDALTHEQLEEYRAYARAREKELRGKVDARRERGWELARQAAVILKAEFGASRVVVFGSLLHPQLFHLLHRFGASL